MTKPLTGPQSFKATIVPRRCTFKSHKWDCACEQPDTLTFDASNAVSKAEQRALFADYTAKAGELGYKLPRAEAHPRRVQYTVNGEWFDAPKFTARPMSANERHWLGREVGFRPYNSNVFAPTGIMAIGMTLVIITGGIDITHGTVWSLSHHPKSFWVYVEGSGFYSVREADFLIGVNA